jgi:hypothetical protein
MLRRTPEIHRDILSAFGLHFHSVFKDRGDVIEAVDP